MARYDTMMKKFIDSLREEYNKPSTLLAMTGNHHILINNQFPMIDMDQVAKCYLEDEDTLSTVDGMHVCKKNGETKFFFVEFKNMNLDMASESPYTFDYLYQVRNMIYHLEKKLKEDEKFVERGGDDYAYNFLKEYDKCERYLYDGIKHTLRIKPFSTLVLLHKLFDQFIEHEKEEPDEKFSIPDIEWDIFKKNPDTIESFSKFKFYYVVVYSTSTEGLSSNRSHSQYKRGSYFDFLKKLMPYPFFAAFPCKDEKFNILIDKIKDCDDVSSYSL